MSTTVMAAARPERASLESSVLSAIAGLGASLPDALVADLTARARVLARRARERPDGEAAAELAAMVDDLRGMQDTADASAARDLRRELARARAAAREVGGRDG